MHPRKMILILTLLFVSVLSLPGCQDKKAPVKVELPNLNPYPSTYQAAKHKPFVIEHVHVLTGDGGEQKDTSVLVENGKIKAIGDAIQLPDKVVTINGKGKWLTPGLIDVHSHMGVYSSPQTPNNSDGNELTNPVTAEVWAEHSVWPEDPQFEKALAGGVTTVQILPGSGNLIGGLGVTLKNVPSMTVQGMKFPGAPYGLKMACGENPKRVYGSRKRAPSTRMGNMAGYRQAWIKAQDYQRSWNDYVKRAKAGDKKAKKPKRNLQLETLVGILEGRILVHNHCYRADEMAQMIDLSKEFGYKITAFHHAVEAYKAAKLLKKEHICAAMWADWWGFKQEAFDMVRENIALVDMVGACAMIHSDDAIGVQHLNQEIAKAMSAGNRMGLHLKGADAIQWATLNPAKALGIADKTGSIEMGKNADLTLWNGNPMSVYTKADMVWIDGVKQFDRITGHSRPTSDFNLGIITPEGDRP